MITPVVRHGPGAEDLEFLGMSLVRSTIPQTHTLLWISGRRPVRLHAGQVHANRHVTPPRPKLDPLGKRTAASAMHQHHRRPRSCGPGAVTDRRRRRVVCKHMRRLAMVGLAHVPQCLHLRRLLEPLKLRCLAQLLQVPGHSRGQLRCTGNGIRRESGAGDKQGKEGFHGWHPTPLRTSSRPVKAASKSAHHPPRRTCSPPG